MKTFRIIDLAVQGIMILTALFFGINSLFGNTMNLFFYFYFIIGSWQMISLLIHYFFSKPTSLHHMRAAYAKICLYIFILGLVIGGLFLLAPVTGFFLALYGYGLLWFTPVLAIFYFFICWKEYSLVIKKELIHLK